MRGENVKLRRVVVERLPHVASKVFEKCTTEESMLLIDDEDELSDDDEEEGRNEHIYHKIGGLGSRPPSP